jgi:4-amino-4-deoxy-L-arabinose transferase-like glycosyltransferase
LAVRDRLRAVPAPLAALLGTVALVGIAWALLLPPWQSPDENSHFGYAQLLAERFELPAKTGKPLFSTEQDLAQSRSNSDQTAQSLVTRPEWSEEAYDRWQAADRELPDSARGDGGGPNPASTNPPLYYLYETPAYLAASGGDIFARLYLMRLFSVVLLLVTAAAAWLLAGELFGPVRPLQLVAAAVAGLQPMVTFIGSSVTPDGLLFALWSIAFWLGVRILKRGLRGVEAVALFGVVGLAVTTKATSYALLPAALFVLAVGVMRLRRQAVPGTAAIAVTALLAFAVPAGGWLATARALDRPAVNQVATVPGKPAPTITSFSVRDLGSYLWQFYLPKLPFQNRYGGMPDLPVYDIWLKGGWGAFGWLEIEFPAPVYVVLAILTVAILAAAAAAVVRALPRIDWAVAVFLALAVLTLLAGLHWTEFRTLVGGSGPFNQGRYLLPLIPIAGAATAAAVSLLPARRRALGAGVAVGGLLVLQLFSLAIVTARFYA